MINSFVKGAVLVLWASSFLLSFAVFSLGCPPPIGVQPQPALQDWCALLPPSPPENMECPAGDAHEPIVEDPEIPEEPEAISFIEPDVHDIDPVEFSSSHHEISFAEVDAHPDPAIQTNPFKIHQPPIDEPPAHQICLVYEPREVPREVVGIAHTTIDGRHVDRLHTVYRVDNVIQKCAGSNGCNLDVRLFRLENIEMIQKCAGSNGCNLDVRLFRLENIENLFEDC